MAQDRKEYNRLYRLTHKEHILQLQRRWRMTHKEQERQKAARYYQANKKAKNLHNSEYVKSLPPERKERLRLQKKAWREKNRDWNRLRSKMYRQMEYTNYKEWLTYQQEVRRLNKIV